MYTKIMYTERYTANNSNLTFLPKLLKTIVLHIVMDNYIYNTVDKNFKSAELLQVVGYLIS